MFSTYEVGRDRGRERGRERGKKEGERAEVRKRKTETVFSHERPRRINMRQEKQEIGENMSMEDGGSGDREVTGSSKDHLSGRI